MNPRQLATQSPTKFVYVAAIAVNTAQNFYDTSDSIFLKSDRNITQIGDARLLLKIEIDEFYKPQAKRELLFILKTAQEKEFFKQYISPLVDRLKLQIPNLDVNTNASF
jgi:hypothetical protein